jgi:deoxyribonuclease-4
VILGAHVRRGGAVSAVAECRLRGADCGQIFLSNPRAWSSPRHDAESVDEFRTAWREAGLGPLSVHAPYLVNVASPNPEFLQRSRALLRATLEASETFHADLLVIHAGAGGSGTGREAGAALDRAAVSLRSAVVNATTVRVLVELMAGTSGSVASTVSEAERLLDAVGDDRLGFCLDTCHLFAAGYALDTSEGVEELVGEIVEHGLLDRIWLVHANDSVYGRGGGRDRHAYLDAGLIGRAGWRALVASPLARVPWITETAGDPGRQRADLDLLRGLATAENGR